VDCGVAALRAGPANDRVGEVLLHNSKDGTPRRAPPVAMKPACPSGKETREPPGFPRLRLSASNPPLKAAAMLPLPGTVLRRDGSDAELSSPHRASVLLGRCCQPAARPPEIAASAATLLPRNDKAGGFPRQPWRSFLVMMEQAERSRTTPRTARRLERHLLRGHHPAPLERRRGNPPGSQGSARAPPPAAKGGGQAPLPGTVLRRDGAGAEGGEGQARSGPRRDRAQAAWRGVRGAKAAEHGSSGRSMRAQPRADAPLPLRPAGPRQRAPRASADRTCDGQTLSAAGSRRIESLVARRKPARRD